MSFAVGGETIKAHRSILCGRSGFFLVCCRLGGAIFTGDDTVENVSNTNGRITNQRNYSDQGHVLRHLSTITPVPFLGCRCSYVGLCRFIYTGSCEWSPKSKEDDKKEEKKEEEKVEQPAVQFIVDLVQAGDRSVKICR